MLTEFSGGVEYTSMAFRIFVSYRNGSEEQLVVWRLQTLAAAYGINVFVPPRNGLPRNAAQRPKQLPDEIVRMIDRSDCVLAIMTGDPGPAVQAELTYALAKQKTIIPILKQGMQQPSFLSHTPVFRFSSSNPGKVEADVIEFLRQQQFSKQRQQAVGALVAIGVGLFLLSAFSEK
jgi:nucleoside 2-deoxyribosyltransferase